MAARDGFHAIQIKESVFDSLDKLRTRYMKQQSLQELSWTNFLSHVVTELEKGEKERV